MSRAPKPDPEVTLGRILASFGVRGEVRVFLHNRNSDLLGQEIPVILQSPSGERRSCKMRLRPGAGKRVLGSIPGVTDKASAEALKHLDIRYAKSLLPDLVEGEFYQGDCIDIRYKNKLFATGICEYGNDEISQIMGYTSDDIQNILGYQNSNQVVHHLNLVINKEGIEDESVS